MNILKRHWIPLVIFLLFIFLVGKDILHSLGSKPVYTQDYPTYNISTNEWRAPSLDLLTPEDELVRYGHSLIVNTAYYLGPQGTVAQVSNGMNCQNCHLEGGTKNFANAFSGVASVYPVFRPRSGIVESIAFRVNDCLKRSLNGEPIDSNSQEMKAIIAYMKWLGKDVPKSVKPVGAGTEELAYLDRAADPDRGRQVYSIRCARCHGSEGAGALLPNSNRYLYPPLWGPHSYNTGAGIFRLSRFAGYVKNNMPQDSASKGHSLLSAEDAWDVAAFVNSQPRPEKTFAGDWPDISKKAVDCPNGPYVDEFSEHQHKYGPFKPIVQAMEERKKAKNKMAGL